MCLFVCLFVCVFVGLLVCLGKLVNCMRKLVAGDSTYIPWSVNYHRKGKANVTHSS